MCVVFTFSVRRTLRPKKELIIKHTTRVCSCDVRTEVKQELNNKNMTQYSHTKGGFNFPLQILNSEVTKSLIRPTAILVSAEIYVSWL